MRRGLAVLAGVGGSVETLAMAAVLLAAAGLAAVTARRRGDYGHRAVPAAVGGLVVCAAVLGVVAVVRTRLR